MLNKSNINYDFLRNKTYGFFEKYLTIWVALCIDAGIFTGNFAGESIAILIEMELFKENIHVAQLQPESLRVT